MSEHPTITALRATAQPDTLYPPCRGQESMVVNAVNMVAIGAMSPRIANYFAAAVNAAPHLIAEVDALRAQLEALASLIKRWPTCPHWQDCATLNRGGDCTCGAVEADLARAEARRLLGVED